MEGKTSPAVGLDSLLVKVAREFILLSKVLLQDEEDEAHILGLAQLQMPNIGLGLQPIVEDKRANVSL